MTPFDAAWLGGALRLATPLLLTSTGESIAQRAGVINIGLEGMMLSGAFGGYWIGAATGSPWLGVLGALVVGVLVGALTAVTTVYAQADQIVVGVGLNLVAVGGTTFLFRDQFADSAEKIGPIQRVSIPLLDEIPLFGDALFNQSPLVYLALSAVPVAGLVLNRTNFGLSVRAAGDSPTALDTAGVDVSLIRFVATAIAGGMAALGGAFLSLGQLGLFNENMTAGRGFLSLAAVIFGRWRPSTVAVACLLFGMVDALQLRLQSIGAVPRTVWLLVVILAVAAALRSRSIGRRVPSRPVIVLVGIGAIAGWAFVAQPTRIFPPQLWLALPYALTLFALATLQNRDDSPVELGVPYSRLDGR